MSAFQKMTIRGGWQIEQTHAFRAAGELFITLPNDDIAVIEDVGGSSDSWWAYIDPTDSDVVFVARLNYSLGYVGLEEYARPSEPFERWQRVEERSYFAQEEAVEEIVGPGHLQPCTIVRRLFEFAHDRY